MVQYCLEKHGLRFYRMCEEIQIALNNQWLDEGGRVRRCNSLQQIPLFKCKKEFVLSFLSLSASCSCVCQLLNPSITNLSICSKKDTVTLDVSVDDSLWMEKRQGFEHSTAHTGNLLLCQAMNKYSTSVYMHT